jgi:ABC-2 type transport system ATP-binding protein
MQATRLKLGYLPQTFSFYDRFSALDTVEYVGWLKCVDKADLRQRAQEALGEVGLLDLANMPMRKLSGGMVRRVGIAQAIVNQPTVLLLDEPSAGLDPQQRIELRALLRRLGERATVLLSTHLVEDVASACERVVVLGEGQVRFMGQVEELAELAEGDSIGDSTLERGFTSVLRRR